MTQVVNGATCDNRGRTAPTRFHRGPLISRAGQGTETTMFRPSLVFVLAASIGCSGNRADAQKQPAGAAPAAPAAPAAAPAPEAAAVPGELPLDQSQLRDDEKATLKKLVSKFGSVCKKPHSLEVSLKTDPGCRRSLYAGKFLVRLLSEHKWLPSEIEEQYEQRYVDPKNYNIDITGAPLRGDAKAPVTIVEFSDFQCPHCKRAQPVIDKVLDEYRGQVKLYFKNYPIRAMHPDAVAAAAAALAAGKQGKFWAYHDRLFATNQEAYPPTLLEKIATDVKLDLAKWKADLEPMRADVDRDHEAGEKADVQATPSFYINGKKFLGHLQFEDMKEWIDEELNK